MIASNTSTKTFGAAFLCGGSGLGAVGMMRSVAEWRGVRGNYVILGSVDVDPEANADFEALTGAPAHCVDLFSRQDYIDFHGKEPPPDWEEATAETLRRLFPIAPDAVFLSAPCKGLSALLPKALAQSRKYQALNNLSVRCVQLALEAWADDLSIVWFENVPRITSRGAGLLKTIVKLFKKYGWEMHMSTHDCGELGGLGQTRKRFLLAGRNPRRMPVYMYQPPRKPLKSIGDVIGTLPLPGDPNMGPMHRLPRLQWKTWVRLALIPAGGDWRDLRNIEGGEYLIQPYMDESVTHGTKYRVTPFDQPAPTATGARIGSGAAIVADPRIPTDRPNRRSGQLEVVGWDKPSPTVTSEDTVGSGAKSVADPRWHDGAYGVQQWGEPGRTVTSGASPSCGPNSIADPRLGHKPRNGVFRVVRWDEPSPTVIGSASVRGSNGAAAVADPRLPPTPRFNHVERVTDWNQPCGTVAGGSRPAQGAIVAADPRLGCEPRSGAYRVIGWHQTAPTVTGAGDVHSQGAAVVSDPRIPNEAEQGVWVIVALDGTWHRPLTTLELAVLQGLGPYMPDGTPLKLAGNSDARWRERIGNGVPVQTAQAIGETGLISMLAASMGEEFIMSTYGTPIWVEEFGEWVTVH